VVVVLEMNALWAKKGTLVGDPLIALKRALSD
jgi:hypothetical protein